MCSSPRLPPFDFQIGRSGSYRYPPWIYPPAEFEPIDQLAYINLPAIGSTADILNFKVPTGKNGIILEYGNDFVGGGWVAGTGGLVWQILRDKAAVDGYDHIVAFLGTVQSPTRHPSGFRIFENQLIEFTIQNVSVIVSGPPPSQACGARLAGWYYPKEYEDPFVTTM